MSQYSDSKFNFDDPNSSWTMTFKMIPPKAKVIDIGCSAGTFGAELIKQKGCVVDGIEIDDSDIEKARKKLRKVYKINVETDKLAVNEKYDVAFMGDVIEHLARPVDALKKIRQLFKPEGRLVFSMPNITHMSVRLMLLKGEIQYGKTGLLDETHMHFYNSEEIYRILNAAGYKIEKLQFVSRDIPTSVLEEELSEIGLKMTNKFKELAQSTNAAAYQFIGSASLASRPLKQKLPPKSPIDVTDKRVNLWRKQSKKKHEELRRRLDVVLSERDEARHRLSQIENSRSWKLARSLNKAAKPARHLSKKIKK